MPAYRNPKILHTAFPVGNAGEISVYPQSLFDIYRLVSFYIIRSLKVAFVHDHGTLSPKYTAKNRETVDAFRYAMRAPSPTARSGTRDYRVLHIPRAYQPQFILLVGPAIVTRKPRRRPNNFFLFFFLLFIFPPWFSQLEISTGQRKASPSIAIIDRCNFPTLLSPIP